MIINLEKKISLVTGAGRGLGESKSMLQILKKEIY
jgi:hypothetical protein